MQSEQQLHLFSRRALLSGALLAAAALAFTTAKAGAAQLFDKLPQGARAQLERGEQVVRTQDMPGSKLPAITIYQIVDVPPEAAFAIFTDFNDHVSYLRDCCGMRQSVIKDIAVGGNPRVQKVFYELQVPVLSNERYELQETLSKADDGSYAVTWKKVGGDGRSEDVVGRAYFEPHDGGTMVSYYNFVTMNIFGAGLFAGEAVDRTKATVGAMVRRMSQVYLRGGPKLEAQLARVRATLGE